MLTIDRPRHWLCVEEAALERTMEALDQALAVCFPVQEQVWAETLRLALAELEEALAGHVAATSADNGLLSPDDLSNAMLPTLTRREEKLRRQVICLRQEAGTLRREAADLADHDPREASSRWNFGHRPPAARALQRRTGELLTILRKLRDQEMAVLLEDVTRDVGAGD